MRALVGQRCLAPQRAPGSLHGTLRAVPSAVALRRARACCSYPESSSNHSATATTTTLESQLSEVNASPVLVLGSPALQGADHAQMCAALEALRDAVPRRSLGGLLERYPAILTAPVATWVDFLGSFGFQRLAVQELLLNSPDVLANSSVFRAGQVFLFLKRLGVPNDQIVGPIFKWRALLSEQVDFEAAADFLASEAGIAPELLGQVACQYPALLAAPVATELAPRLAFLRGLGPEAPGLLRGVLHEDWCGWVHGLANWPTAVAPKLAALEAVVEGGPQAAAALLRRVPEALKYPPESRLVPNLRFMQGAMGLDQQSLAALLRGAPDILSLAPEQLESRWTFLTEAANGGEADLLAYPPYLLASLAKTSGPRLMFVATRGLAARLATPPAPAAAQEGSAAAADEAGPSGRWGEADEEDGDEGGDVGQGAVLDLRWLVEGSDEDFLRRAALELRRAGGRRSPSLSAGALLYASSTFSSSSRASSPVSGSASGSAAALGSGARAGAAGGEEVSEDELLLVRGEYETAAAEWESLLGWCADRAFTKAGRKKFEEQLSLFYLLVQG